MLLGSILVYARQLQIRCSQMFKDLHIISTDVYSSRFREQGGKIVGLFGKNSGKTDLPP